MCCYKVIFHEFLEISINYGCYIVCNNVIWCAKKNNCVMSLLYIGEHSSLNAFNKFYVLKDVVMHGCFEGIDIMLFLNCSVGSDTREWSCEINKN
jgi:hypothetical protein